MRGRSPKPVHVVVLVLILSVAALVVGQVRSSRDGPAAPDARASAAGGAGEVTGPARPAAPTTSAAAGAATATADGSYPTAPPVRVCGDTALLSGPTEPPPGAVVVPPGDNSGLTALGNTPNFSAAGTTYWFAPGLHTLGSDEFAQIVPGNDSVFIGGPGAVIDGQGKNDYAFGGVATGVTLRYLTIRNFTAPTSEGAVNHDPGTGWTFEYNTITMNGGAGLVLGSRNRASYNCLRANSQYGFIATPGAGSRVEDVVLDHNEISENNTGDWETRNVGCGCSGGGKFWDVRGARVTHNYVHDNKSVGLWADTNNVNFLIEGNWIENNDGQGIFYEISYNAAIRNNVVKHNLLKVGADRIAAGEAWPDAAIYISESGGDARVPYSLVGSPTIDISGNLIEDNYNGVTLWEGADRFCNSPVNTSTGYCTLVNPKVVTLGTCTAGTIARAPYRADCRWRTQNVRVHDNRFVMSMERFAGCSPRFCARNAVFSDWGGLPWSPYKGRVVQNDVTFQQNNTFRGNTYVGPWSFVGLHSENPLTRQQWTAAPYGQDVDSTFR